MRTWFVVSFLPFFLLSGCKHRGATGNGPQPVAGSAASVSTDQAFAAKQQAGLLNVQTTEMETDVPAAAQRAIPLFKDALVHLSDDVLAKQPAAASTKVVEQALASVLPKGNSPNDSKEVASAKAAGKNEFDIPEKGDYGGEVKVSVHDPQKGLLLVDESFGIMCGEDNVLLGYSNASGHWHRVLRWQAPPYDKVSGAFGDMFLPTLLDVRRNGHPVLLVVHGTPWCSSTESGFGMDTLEIDRSSVTDKPFWHGEHGYRRADDVPPLAFSSRVTPDGFEIRSSVDDRIGDSVNRVGIMRYAMAGNTMQRTLPIAMNSRESVSEWLDMQRNEAALFTDAAAGSVTWKTWDALTYSGKSTDDAMKIPMLSYGDVRACSDPKHYQVAIETEVYSAGNKAHAPGPSYYVQVLETGTGYRIEAASQQPDATCSGKVIKLKSTGYESQPAEAQ